MSNTKKDIKKIVLAYSGGLDTSVIIPWLKENYPVPKSSLPAPMSASLTTLKPSKRKPMLRALPKSMSWTSKRIYGRIRLADRQSRCRL